jgi:peptidoglycan/LPS O-acetylase OafA/YrhL
VILANPLVVGLGLIGYALYPWHWPVLTFGRIVRDGRPPCWSPPMLTCSCRPPW